MDSKNLSVTALSCPKQPFWIQHWHWAVRLILLWPAAMDALCQLLESFVATNATPVTNALAKQGLMHFRRGMTLFSDKAIDRGKELELRGEMALAAWMSGAALTNADVGAVHGIAGPLGAVCNVPHGTACGLLIPPVFRCMVGKLGNDDTARETRQHLEIASTILFDTAKVEVMLERIEHWTCGSAALEYVWPGKNSPG